MNAERRIQFLVEENSMEVVVRSLVPRILEDMPFDVYSHRGKQELLRKLPERLRGYAACLPSSWRIVVVVDNDGGDCRDLKSRMKDSVPRPLAARVVNRIAVEELEAWFFGDWTAVVEAYPRVPGNVPRRRPYRDPDAIRGGTSEALERILQRAGYFKGGLRKIELAETLAPRMDPSRNQSRSFKAFRKALLDMR